jgi:hypothetical protein
MEEKVIRTNLVVLSVVLAFGAGILSAQDAATDAKKTTVKTGHAISHVGKKVAKGTKAGVKDAGHGTKVVAKDTGKGVKTGAEKTGDGIKDVAKQ